MPTITIADRTIGEHCPCFIVAEAGVNHNGDLDRAFKLIDTAAEAGADAVKFQTFTAERVVSPQAPKAAYQERNAGTAESQFDMLKKLELSIADHRALMDRCVERNLVFLSSPFDEEAVDLLDDLKVAAFKVPSGEITNLPYLHRMGRCGRPVILSTGMTNLEEVMAALDALTDRHDIPICLLHCTSNYPASPESVNLRAINTMQGKLGHPIGFSDHTEGIWIPIAAAARGACMVEKHFTLDRSLPGPDHKASIEPPELKALVEGIRLVESALGDGIKCPQPEEMDTRNIARKSVVAARIIPKGKVIEGDDLTLLRPGTGLPPGEFPKVVGRTAAREIKFGELIVWEMLK
ncbi:N-acetylneuraminate synthase [Magnetospira sp. QH-2]|uniref:N-acetylneuraminate synthase n=1 Tax=Magnetospira sp. (strain QH-2) TaxID=1288970 RepID=UPI0005F9D421|nr:N-acetylneuraminate synthase [Magnetospira sp. QH-2]